MNANKRRLGPKRNVLDEITEALRDVVETLVAPRRPAPQPVPARRPQPRVVRRPDW